MTFTSWIKDIDISNAGMDIIALTSFNEGTPVSLIEAQASSLPIVSTDVGGIKDVVLEGETALLSPSGNTEKFAENLLRLIENDQLRQQMAAKGTSHVKKRFSYQRLCADMSAIYHHLLAEY